MKKISILILLASLLSFTGCYQAIFEAIREDVRPEDATVSGNISSITRYTASDTEFLVVGADNGLSLRIRMNMVHGKYIRFHSSFSLLIMVLQVIQVNRLLKYLPTILLFTLLQLFMIIPAQKVLLIQLQ